MTKLDILIPTLPENHRYLARLMKVLRPQADPYGQSVKITINDAGRSIPTGTKRNSLIKHTDGEYFCMIDDDDMVPAYYVSELMNAIEQSPDVVTFIGHMTTDGYNRKDFTIKLGSKYEEKNGHYYRFPNHLCAFRRAVVANIKFPDVWHTEDYLWAKAIQDKRLLKNEVHIQKLMYHYDYRSKPIQRRR